MVIDTFDGFNVYKDGESHSFVYIDFNNSTQLIDGLTDYLFSEDSLLNYAKCSSKMELQSTNPLYWATLYRNISFFLNEDWETCSIGDVTEDLLDVLNEEYKLVNSDGELLVQKDKVGKIGEYAFHVLLSKYFDLNCIIPKFRCTTDRNMSVFGIDALFLNIEKRCIYFGESKFSKTLSNGIKLANKSLDDYEQQIREEYRLVLTSNDAFLLSDDFKDLFQHDSQICIKFESFIKRAHIDTIGVPVFIAHGKDNSKERPQDYLDMMKKKLHKNSFFGLNVEYVFISLPVINKQEFIETAIKKVVKKQNEFESRCS